MCRSKCLPARNKRAIGQSMSKDKPVVSFNFSFSRNLPRVSFSYRERLISRAPAAPYRKVEGSGASVFSTNVRVLGSILKLKFPVAWSVTYTWI